MEFNNSQHFLGAELDRNAFYYSCFIFICILYMCVYIHIYYYFPQYGLVGIGVLPPPPLLIPHSPRPIVFPHIVTAVQSFSNSQKFYILLHKCIMPLQVAAVVENVVSYCQGVFKSFIGSPPLSLEQRCFTSWCAGCCYTIHL